MRESERLTSDVIAVIVEKVLMNMGVTSHSKVAQILADHSLTFSDCYRNPAVLNFALKEAFGASYMPVVDKIGRELEGFDERQNLAGFMAGIR